MATTTRYAIEPLPALRPEVLPPEGTSVPLLRRWAVLLDSAFAVPGLNVRFGFDALLGLVPGVGDLTTPTFTVLLLVTGLRMGVPLVVLTRMVMNAGIDALIGLVPVIGDVFDLGWKANLKNLELLERHAVPGTASTPADAWVVTAGLALIVFVGVLVVVPVILLAWLIAWVIAQRGLI
jgi:hypothetical protein